MTSSPLTRRATIGSLGALLSSPVWPQSEGPPVLMLRHAVTDPGVGDPPGFRLDSCNTQRNLSAEGRCQALEFGARLTTLGLRPREIRCSRWCRCLDTGREIARGLGAGAPAVQPWPALDSFFDAREREPAQTRQLRERLAALAASRGEGFELWVTHQVNISALTSQGAAMGQALWLLPRRDGGLEARPFAPRPIS